jgi:hypothetical protein
MVTCSMESNVSTASRCRASTSPVTMPAASPPRARRSTGVTTTLTYGYDTAGRLTDGTRNGTLTANWPLDGEGSSPRSNSTQCLRRSTRCIRSHTRGRQNCARSDEGYTRGDLAHISECSDGRMPMRKMMPPYHLVVCLGLAVISSGITAVAHAADHGREGCGRLEVYERLLPLSLEESDAPDVDEMIVLRYIPGDTSIEREYKITLLRTTDGKYRATRVEGKGRSLLSQVREIEKQVERCDDVMRRVELMTTTFDRQALLRSIFDAFRRLRFPLNLESRIYLDYPRYEIVVRAGENQESFTLFGPSAQAPHPHPLILWFLNVAQRLGS